MSAVEGKTVLVTGAAKGIGRAEAELLAASGARVAFTDVDDAGAEAARPFGDRAMFVHHDVTSAAEWARVVTTVTDRFGGIDGLVNNAGVYLPGPLAQADEESFDRQVAVNQKGTFLGLRQVSEQMRRQGRGGSIVNTSSVCGIRGVRGCIAYNATKWAVRGLTRTAAAELGPDGIRVNAVLPGFVDTGFIAVNPPGMNEQAAKDTPLGRLGRPSDIAPLIAYLISDEASFVTGGDFLIDGGWTL